MNQIAQRFRWKMIFITQPIAGKGIILPTELDVKCESMDIPSYTYNITPVRVRQWEVKRNGMLIPNDLTLSFLETTDGRVFDFFSSWQEAVFDLKTGKANNKDLNSAIIMLTLLNNKNEPIRIFTLFGCVLKAYNRGKADNTDEPFKAEIILSFDNLKENKYNISDVIGEGLDLAQQYIENPPEWLRG
jgi:hypothetical protein